MKFSWHIWFFPVLTLKILWYWCFFILTSKCWCTHNFSKGAGVVFKQNLSKLLKSPPQPYSWVFLNACNIFPVWHEKVVDFGISNLGKQMHMDFFEGVFGGVEWSLLRFVDLHATCTFASWHRFVPTFNLLTFSWTALGSVSKNVSVSRKT